MERAAQELRLAVDSATAGASNELEDAIERWADYLEVDCPLVDRARARLAALRIEEAAPAAGPEAAPPPILAPVLGAAASGSSTPPLGGAGEATPPGYSPMPPVRCGPSGPDPFTGARTEVHALAATGAPCPVDQHACMYFSSSEWRFCRMCEWETGHAMALNNGALGVLGVPRATIAAESAAGNDIVLTREQLAALLIASDCRRPALTDSEWDTMPPAAGTADATYLVRSQLERILLRHGIPDGVFNDDIWRQLQEEFDAPEDDEE
jgi:hypothetical protein